MHHPNEEFFESLWNAMKRSINKDGDAVELKKFA